VDAELKSKILVAFQTLPDGCRSAPAGESALVEFEAEFGSIPADFRWFLKTCGGGTVGSEWVDDIDELSATHRRFRVQCTVPDGWKMRDIFVIGWDGSGNPFGIQHCSGAILVEDHDFGGIHTLADSFSTFLEFGLLDKSES